MAARKNARKGARKGARKNGGKNGGNEKLAHPDGLTDAVAAGRAAGGTGTASGKEAARRAGAEDELPTGEERGSLVDPGIVPEGEGDYMGTPHAAVGPQTEAAFFAPNGAIPPNMVASPSGLVPVSAVTSTAEEAEKLLDRRKEDLSREYKGLTKGKRLTDEQIRSMGGAELRAVATDRGYDLSPNAGTRGTRAGFATAQLEDENLEEAD